MIKKEKGATLGIVIVLILFLSLIAFLIMSMATIVSFTVIKNEKLADAEIRLQSEAQKYLNQLTIVTYKTYYYDNVNEENYLATLTEQVTSIINDEYEATYDEENQVFTFILKDETLTVKVMFYDVENQFTFILKDETINKTLTVEVKFYDYKEVDVNKANPFYKILCWESESIKVENPGGE